MARIKKLLGLGAVSIILGTLYGGVLIGSYYSSPHKIHAEDLNNDGVEDIIVIDRNNTKTPFFGENDNRYSSIEDLINKNTLSYRKICHTLNK